MAAPTFDFTIPDTANNVDDDVAQMQDNMALLMAMVIKAAYGVPAMFAASQTTTVTAPTKPTAVEMTGLPGSRKVKVTFAYTGDNPTTVTTQLDSGGGGGYETISTDTLTYDGSNYLTGGTSA